MILYISILIKQNQRTQNGKYKRFTFTSRIWFWFGTRWNFFEHYPLPLLLAKNLEFKHDHFVPIISTYWQMYGIQVSLCLDVDYYFLEIFLHIVWLCTNLWTCLCTFLGSKVNCHWVKAYGSFFWGNKPGPINFHIIFLDGALSWFIWWTYYQMKRYKFTCNLLPPKFKLVKLLQSSFSPVNLPSMPTKIQLRHNKGNTGYNIQRECSNNIFKKHGVNFKNETWLHWIWTIQSRFKFDNVILIAAITMI